MKFENNVLFAAVGFASLFSTAAIAGTTSAEHQHKSGTATVEISLEQAIQANTEQKLAAEARKYTQVSALAGSRQDEMERSKNEVINTYAKWREMKSAVEASRSANASDFKAVEAAAQAYSQANKAFINLQKDILAKNGTSAESLNAQVATNVIPSNAIDVINAAPATAAGAKK